MAKKPRKPEPNISRRTLLKLGILGIGGIIGTWCFRNHLPVTDFDTLIETIRKGHYELLGQQDRKTSQIAILIADIHVPSYQQRVLECIDYLSGSAGINTLGLEGIVGPLDDFSVQQGMAIEQGFQLEEEWPRIKIAYESLQPYLEKSRAMLIRGIETEYAWKKMLYLRSYMKLIVRLANLTDKMVPQDLNLPHIIDNLFNTKPELKKLEAHLIESRRKMREADVPKYSRVLFYGEKHYRVIQSPILLAHEKDILKALHKSMTERSREMAKNIAEIVKSVDVSAHVIGAGHVAYVATNLPYSVLIVNPVKIYDPAKSQFDDFRVKASANPLFDGK